MENIESKEEFIQKYKNYSKNSILERLYEAILIIRKLQSDEIELLSNT